MCVCVCVGVMCINLYPSSYVCLHMCMCARLYNDVWLSCLCGLCEL